nr:Dihydrofolate reductase [uncultured bacterium]AIA14364.1 Dihydrofolate reductase [uncultured bacterium]
MPRISAIAAIVNNRGLGKDNELLVRIPEDLARFKKLTSGHTVIMGRKTYESIGKPLPNRTNIVVTRDAKYEAEGCQVVFSVEEALDLGRQLEPEEIFIIGGGKIYDEMLPYTERLYLTQVEKEVEADTFFPEYKEFTKELEREEKEHEGTKYTWVTLER